MKEKIEVINQIVKDMLAIVDKYLGDYKISLGIADTNIYEFTKEILDNYLIADIDNLVNNDPAVKVVDNEYAYVYKNYKGIKAILYYRIANKLIYKNNLIDDFEDEYQDPFDELEDFSSKNIFLDLARKISEDAAIQTTIEINPMAQIGKGLIIDHGVNTRIGALSDNEKIYDVVIGETCVIGENCCILNGVVLGAVKVNNGIKNKKRHPTVKDNVTICSNVKVLGGITIGKNVFISPNCIITKDIPDNTKVTMINELQVSKNDKSNPLKKTTIYGLVPENNELHLYGNDLDNTEISVVDKDHNVLDNIIVIIKSHDSKHIIFELRILNKELEKPKDIFLSITTEFNTIYIYNSLSLNQIINSLY